jgi:type IV pilus assembly protein PilX
MRTPLRYGKPARQGGATLVIALLILVLIMMIGITAVSTSNTQYKLAGNLQFEDGAMNNAEAAVSAAENWLITSTSAVPPVPHYLDGGFTTAGVTTGLLPVTPVVSNATLLSMTWTDSNSQVVAGNSAQRYIIQLMATNSLLTGSSAVVGRQGAAVCNKVNNYLITGRGTSHRGATKFVQSFYSVLSCP